MSYNYVRWAIVGAILCTEPATAAGIVCRSQNFVGLEATARLASIAVGPLTSDGAAIRLYAEHTSLGFYYHSNFHRDGVNYGTKVLSETPMTVREIVENLLYTSRSEADLASTATDQIMELIKGIEFGPAAVPPPATLVLAAR